MATLAQLRERYARKARVQEPTAVAQCAADLARSTGDSSAADSPWGWLDVWQCGSGDSPEIIPTDVMVARRLVAYTRLENATRYVDVCLLRRQWPRKGQEAEVWTRSGDIGDGTLALDNASGVWTMQIEGDAEQGADSYRITVDQTRRGNAEFAPAFCKEWR